MNILFIVYQFSLESTKLKIKFSISIIIRKKSQKNQCLPSPLLSGLFLSESYLSQMLYSTIPSTLTYIIYVPKTCKYNDFDIFLLVSLLPQASLPYQVYRDIFAFPSTQRPENYILYFFTRQCPIQKITTINLNTRLVSINIEYNPRNR